MSHFEVVITLITIVYGLVITNLFASLHKLIKAKKNVQWHWLPLLTAWYILFLILKNWWGITYSVESRHWDSILIFILYGHLLIVLYLLSSSILPDSIPKEGINLKEYYFQNHGYIWGLMCGVIIISVIISVFRANIAGIPVSSFNLALNGVILLVTILLIVNKKLILHSVIIILFVLLLINEIISRQ